MNILDYVGKTPMVKLHNEDDNAADIYVKLEMFNPGGSVKTRVALCMIEEAEKNGVLHQGDCIIEATGGNTGIGLALASNVKGYHFTAVVPDNYSKKRIRTLQLYGAEVIMSDSSLGKLPVVFICKFSSHPGCRPDRVRRRSTIFILYDPDAAVEIWLRLFTDEQVQG